MVCEISDLSIPWKKISRGRPRGRRYADDRAPTIEEKKNIDITQLNQDLHEESREIKVLHKTDNTKDGAIAALSDRLQNLIEEVENLKRRK
jgi:hypothetical protein